MQRDAERQRRTARKRLVFPGIIAAVLAVVVLVAVVAVGLELAEDPDDALEDETSLVTITNEPEEYIGESVLTSGTVNSMLAGDAFTVHTSNTLVLLPDNGGTTDDLVENQQILIRATVIEFSAERAADILGRDVAPEEYGQFEGETALVASAVTTTLDPLELESLEQ
jgi:hypothetical protein